MPRQAGEQLTRRLARLAGAEVRELRLTGSQHQWSHYRVTLAGGRMAFAKVAGGLGAVFSAEAQGLRWLHEAGAVPVPEGLDWDEDMLVVSWVPGGAPDAAAAARFGRDLARMHASGARRVGASWPGFLARLPLANGGPRAGGA